MGASSCESSACGGIDDQPCWSCSAYACCAWRARILRGVARVVVRRNRRRIRARRRRRRGTLASPGSFATSPDVLLFRDVLRRCGVRGLVVVGRQVALRVVVDGRLLLGAANARRFALRVELRDGIALGEGALIRVERRADLERGERLVVDAEISGRVRRVGSCPFVTRVRTQPVEEMIVDGTRLRLVVEAQLARRGATIERRRLTASGERGCLELVLDVVAAVVLVRVVRVRDGRYAARRRGRGGRRAGLHRTDRRTRLGIRPQGRRSKLREHASLGHSRFG
jgi:hypothetical protein